MVFLDKVIAQDFVEHVGRGHLLLVSYLVKRVKWIR